MRDDENEIVEKERNTEARTANEGARQLSAEAWLPQNQASKCQTEGVLADNLSKQTRPEPNSSMQDSNSGDSTSQDATAEDLDSLISNPNFQNAVLQMIQEAERLSNQGSACEEPKLPFGEQREPYEDHLLRAPQDTGNDSGDFEFQMDDTRVRNRDNINRELRRTRGIYREKSQGHKKDILPNLELFDNKRRSN